MNIVSRRREIFSFSFAYVINLADFFSAFSIFFHNEIQCRGTL